MSSIDFMATFAKIASSAILSSFMPWKDLDKLNMEQRFFTSVVTPLSFIVEFSLPFW